MLRLSIIRNTMSAGFIESFNQKQTDEFERETGIKISNIQETSHDQSPFAIPTKEEVCELAPGVIFERKVITFPDGAFTNSYETTSDSGSSNAVSITSSGYPFSIKRSLINDKHLLASTNAGFFFFADEATRHPIDPTYNLCVRNGHIIGLPSSDSPAMYVNGQDLEAREILAKGIMNIDGEPYEWSGAKRQDGTTGITLYNSSCCTIEHMDDGAGGTKRVLNESLNYTPVDTSSFDLVIKIRPDGLLYIEDIHEEGGTELFSGNFILNIKGIGRDRFKIGSTVNPETLDGLNLDSLSSAVSIGPNVHHFNKENDHPINHVASLGSKPPFTQRRMARTVVCKDNEGRIHLRIFDGAPRTSNFQGVTPKELASIIPQEDVQWAFNLDPGQSSRMAIRESNSSVKTYGNTHYLRLPQDLKRQALWSPSNGRRVASTINFLKR